MRRSSCTFPAALTAAMMPWIYPFGGERLLLYLTWVLHTYLASKTIMQLAISRYPSDIAIESDHLAF
eukprot:6048915-Pleurochrysis_carterae.AAC.1